LKWIRSVLTLRSCLKTLKGIFLRLFRPIFVFLFGLLNQVCPAKKHKNRTKNPSKICHLSFKTASEKLSRDLFNYNIRWLTLSAALFISIFLCIAAYGKMFHPMEKIKHLDRFTSIFEILFILSLVAFRKRRGLWLAAAVIFGSWGGYAAFWCCIKMPCSCFGSMISLPSAYALSLDALFFVISCTMALMLGALKRSVYLIMLSAFLGALMGYAFAEWIFFERIVGVVWHLL
jgi:hypothetical protein